ncbi:hypothetical protein LOAG_10315 [Loa loa]|nr:hypothetical protein LOAG_10315 [Loa loa]EFO18180.2 hypothetical protein LOAG_10315 [Loa loa]
MTKVTNKKDDDANDLRPTNQAAVAPDNLLVELLEPNPAVQTEYFLEACSNKEGEITNSTSAIGNGCESIDNNEESAGNDGKTNQHELKISDVPVKTEAIRIANEREKEKLQSDGDSSDGNKEGMTVDNDEKSGNSENSSDTIDENNDDDDIGEVDKEIPGETDDEEYVVEKILDRRYNRRRKRIEYLIKWAGYDNESENTWESAENCKSAPDAIREYEESLKKNATKYLLRSRPVTMGSGSNDDEKEPSKFLKRKTDEIKKELYSEENSSDDSEEISSKRTKVDCILGVKKQDNEILAVVRFEDGRYDLIPTQVLVSKCPKKLVNYYERSLKFVSS